MAIDTRGPREVGQWVENEAPWFFKRGAPFTTPDPTGFLRAHNGERVTVLEVVKDAAYEAFLAGRELSERFRLSALLSYRVRFADGTEVSIVESELHETRYYLDALRAKVLKGEPL